MAFLSKDRLRGEDEDNFEGRLRSATRSNSRRVRHEDRGVESLDSLQYDKETLKPLSKRVTAKRSFVSLISKSVEPQSTKHGTARASTSHPSQTPSPRADMPSPTMRRRSPPSPRILISMPSLEDLSTYHANLARFQTERAARVAELGLDISELSCIDSPIPESPSMRDEQAVKTSGLSLNRGLRAYWGGGTSSESTIQTTGRSSEKLNLTFDEKADREALKDWWDRLGTETPDTRVQHKARFEVSLVPSCGL